MLHEGQSVSLCAKVEYHDAECAPSWREMFHLEVSSRMKGEWKRQVDLLLNHLYRTNIFCDKYDPVQNTYCKRLRVLCPEHTKEPKVVFGYN